MEAEITAVINTRDNLNNLKKLINSLLQQTLSCRLYNIFVVDDSHGKETTKYISELKEKIQISYMSSDGLGYQVGRNQAFRQATSQTLLFLDDTCLAPATLLENHYLAHKKHQHSIVRGPMAVQKGDKILELSKITAPQLDFSLINSSIPKLGLATIDGFNIKCKSNFQNTEMYWRLRQANFKSVFVNDCYCFQYDNYFEDYSLEMAERRAKELASSAIDYYLGAPNEKTKKAINLDMDLGFFTTKLVHISPIYSMLSSLVRDKRSETTLFQAQILDIIFYKIFYDTLKKKLKNFA